MKTVKVTFCAMMAAVGTLFLFLAEVVPVLDLSCLALSGVCMALCVVRAGPKGGIAAWAATGLLSFILLANLTVTIAFLLLFGLYPVIKAIFERLKSKVLEWLLKSACFFAAFAALQFFVASFFDGLIPEGWPVWLIWPAGGVFFVLYDIALSRLIWFLTVRLRFDKL